MADLQAGSAFVQLMPSMKGFHQRAQAEIRKMPDLVAKLKVTLAVDDAALAGLRKRIERVRPVIRVRAVLDQSSIKDLRAAVKAIPLEVGVMLTLAAGARAKLQAELDALRPQLTVKVIPILGRLGGSGFGDQSVKVKADTDKRSFGDALIYVTRLGAALKSIALPVAAVAAVPTILGLAAALAEAAQAGAILPAVISAGAFAMVAIKVATMGFGDALKNIGDPEKFAEAIAKLSPAAREAAIAVRDLRAPFLEMKDVVQDQFFAGIADQIRALGTTYLPILQETFGGIAAAANITATEVAQSFLEARRIEDVALLGNEAIGTFANLSGVVKPLVSIFTDVAAVGAPMLTNLTAGAGGLAQSLADSVSAARDSGGIQKFISEGLSALGDLAQVAGNVGEILGGIFDAANISGGGFLGNLKTITQSIADVVNSASGQEALGSFFSTLAIVAGTVGDVLKALAPSLAVVMDALETGVRALAPSIPPLAEALGGVLIALAPLLPAAGELGAILADAIPPVIKALTPAIGKFAEMLGPFLGEAARKLAPLLVEVGRSVGDVLMRALVAIEPLLPVIIDAFGKFIEAVLPLVPIVTELAIQFIDKMVPILPELAELFIALIEAIVPILPPLSQMALMFIPILIELLPLLIPIIEGWTFVLQLVTPAIQKICDVAVVFQGIMDRVWNFVGGVIERVVYDGIQPAFNTLKNGVDEVGRFFDRVVEGIGTTWEKMRGQMARPINFFIDTIWNDKIIKAWNAITGWVPGLGDAVKLGPLDRIDGYATGGIYPGYTPGRDVGFAAVSGGEAIMRPEWTRAMGRSYISAANHAARTGGISGVKTFLRNGGPGGLAEGRAKQMLMTRFPLDDYRGAFAYGGVAPHVAAAADEIVRLFGPMPGGIGGVGQRSGPSDHPKGLALDFMVLNNTALGNKIAAHFLANGQRMLMKYIIWLQRINEGGGWKGMENRGSPTANHMDHPHVSFLAGGGGRTFADGGDSGGGFFDFIGKIMDTFNPIRGVIDSGIDARLPGSGPYKDVAKRIPHVVLDHVIDLAKEQVTKLLGFGVDGFKGAVKGIAGVFGGEPGVRQPVGMVAKKWGWPFGGPQGDALDWIINKESSWNPRAQNPNSTAFGLYQFLDSTWATVGGKKTSEPGLQAEYGNRYIKQRYGDPISAKQFHMSRGWYDDGGWLEPGLTLAYNGTGKREAIYTAEQNDWIGEQLAGKGGDTYQFHAHGVSDPYEAARLLETRKRQRDLVRLGTS